MTDPYDIKDDSSFRLVLTADEARDLGYDVSDGCYLLTLEGCTFLRVEDNHVSQS